MWLAVNDSILSQGGLASVENEFAGLTDFHCKASTTWEEQRPDCHACASRWWSPQRGKGFEVQVPASLRADSSSLSGQQWGLHSTEMLLALNLPTWKSFELLMWCWPQLLGPDFSSQLPAKKATLICHETLTDHCHLILVLKKTTF